MFDNLIRLLYPDFCIHCGRPLVGKEHNLCSDCMIDIPWSNEAHAPNNITEMRLAGQIPFVAATSLLHFRKGNVAQSIVHQIKYYGRTSLAIQYGRILGTELRASNRFADVDYLVPVPLHWFKRYRRGYNQSQLICKGIEQTFNKPIAHRYLYRTRFTNTQTHKNREQRISNMQGVFAVRHPEKLENTHILLVDDIITTGATTVNCYQAIKDIPGIRISVAALGLVRQN